MSEPKRVQIIRPHENVKEFTYIRDNDKTNEYSYTQMLFDRKEYQAIGLKHSQIIQSIPLRENWPITMGNGFGAISTGFLGGMITRRMASNLLLHLSQSTLPASGACLLACSMSHLVSYYLLVLQPMLSNDPTLCTTCLEIRAFALASFIPITMGTSIAVLSNLSTCLLHKTIHLPQFKVQAYPEWIRFFRKHAFKGMSHRYYFAYPLLNGFLASMIFYGQNYYWTHNLQYRIETFEKELTYKEPKKTSKIFQPIEHFFIKLFGSKTK